MTAATRRAPRPRARAPPDGLPTHAPVDSAGEKPSSATRAARVSRTISTQKLCIGGPDGKLTDNVPVESDTCNTEYTVKYL